MVMTEHDVPALHYPQLRTAADTIAFHGKAQPDQAALICEGHETTYAQLHQASNQIAHALRETGIQPGSRVAFLGKESQLYYGIFFACAKTSAVLVPVNWRLAAREVEHILRDSAAEVVFAEHEYTSQVADLHDELPSLRHLIDVDQPGDSGPRGAGLAAWAAGHPADDIAAPAGPDDAIVQLYTSGTTGLPKGVVLAHRNFFAIRNLLAEHGIGWLDFHPGDRSLVAIPSFHVAGIWWAMQGFNAGITNVLLHAFTPHDAVRAIAEHQIASTLAVPAMLQMMLDEPAATREAFASLRTINYGGSPISEALLSRCLEMFTGDLIQMYGLTETGNCAVCLPPADHVPGSPRLRSAGRPYPGVAVKVLGPSGEQVPNGKAGEICIRTPAAMLGYWNLPEATRSTLAGGWVHTGDAGYADEDGYIFICDRIRDMVIVAGENVYPAEVENALCRHPAVKEAAVIGVPDERWGEALHAFVALRSGHTATARELRLTLRGSIADFKIPAKFTFVDSVPRNPSGKILRRQLRERYWANRDRQVN